MLGTNLIQSIKRAWNTQKRQRERTKTKKEARMAEKNKSGAGKFILGAALGALAGALAGKFVSKKLEESTRILKETEELKI